MSLPLIHTAYTPHFLHLAQIGNTCPIIGQLVLQAKPWEHKNRIAILEGVRPKSPPRYIPPNTYFAGNFQPQQYLLQFRGNSHIHDFVPVSAIASTV